MIRITPKISERPLPTRNRRAPYEMPLKVWISQNRVSTGLSSFVIGTMVTLASCRSYCNETDASRSKSALEPYQNALKLPLLSPLRLPFRPQRGAIDGLASEVDGVDLADVGDVVERIGIEHDEIGALARRHRAELV